MASVTKKNRDNGLTWYVTYRIPNGLGGKRQIWFRCDDAKEAYTLLDDVAQAEKKGVEYLRKTALTVPETATPSNMTVTKLVEAYVKTYGFKNWSPSTLKSSRGIIENYIKPFIGSVHIMDVTPKFIQAFYDDLPNHDAVPKHQQKAPPKKISARTCKEIHKILRPAFNMAVVWGEVVVNPTLAVNLPKQEPFKREQWVENEVENSLSVCDDDLMYLGVCLVYGCSLRSGELAALTWPCVNANEETIEKDNSSIYIDKTVERVNKQDIKDTGGRGIIQTFPNLFGNAKSVIVLKIPKNESSIRRIYLASTVARLLMAHKARQERQKAFLGPNYHDYGLVIAQDDGRPYEVKDLSKRFKKFLRKNNLREVDFYSLRHSSVTEKLRATHDVKAVQGDTGHATADMLQNVYAGILDEDRKNTAKLMEESIFSKLKHHDLIENPLHSDERNDTNQ